MCYWIGLMFSFFRAYLVVFYIDCFFYLFIYLYVYFVYVHSILLFLMYCLCLLFGVFSYVYYNICDQDMKLIAII